MSWQRTVPKSLLARLPLFAGLAPDELALLTAGARSQDVPNGDFLFHRGDPCRGFYVVQRGQIKLVLPSQRGTDKVIDIVHPGQSFGEAVMFLEKDFMVDARAVLDSTVIYVPRQALFEGIERFPSVARKMLAYLAARAHRLLLDVEAMALYSSKQRLVTYLLERLPASPETRKHAVDKWPITLDVAKGVLASRLDMSAACLSRLLQDMSTHGVIAVRGRRIDVLDLAALQADSVKPLQRG